MQKITVLLLILLLSSCKVGPNFQPPEVPKFSKYSSGPQITRTVSAQSPSGKAQYMRYRRDISSSWWTIFHSKELNALIDQGLKNNATLEISKANLSRAKLNLLAEAGAKLFPSASTQFFGNRERTTLLASGINLQPLPGQPQPFSVVNQFDLYNASISLSYDLDLFGGNQRELEALRAAIDYERFELEAAYLTLTGNIVTTAITIASLEEQLTTTKALIHCQKELVRRTKMNYRLGHTARMDVFESIDALQQIEVTLPPLQDSLAKKQNALALLIGSLPGQSPLHHLKLKAFHLPQDLPVSLPSQLAKQRPDIRSAEAQLHRASAKIGVATANLYPNINIIGNYGWFSTTLSSLFNPVNSVWNYGGQVAQTLFKGGSLRAKQKVAVADYEVALARYKRVTLSAFFEVADVLHALKFDAETLKSRAAAEKNALNRLKLVATQHQLGTVDYLKRLMAKKGYLQAHLKVIEAEAARFTDSAALFQSLGGGWWNRPA